MGSQGSADFGGMELHSHVCPVIGRHPRGRLPAPCLNADDSGFGSRGKASCPLLARSISSVGGFLPIVRHHQLIVRYDVQVAARHTCCLERRVARRHRHRGTPVSYTHLRAHETVLDLVCRLLLEKKKKKKITNNNTS